MDNENNELRCYANEIILKLREAGEVKQVELLFWSCVLSLRDIGDAATKQEAIDFAKEKLGIL